MLQKMSAVSKLYGVMVVSLVVFAVACIWTADEEAIALAVAERGVNVGGDEKDGSDLELSAASNLTQTSQSLDPRENSLQHGAVSKAGLVEDVTCAPFHNNFLVYNRIPRTGSNSLLHVIKKLSDRNSFQHMRSDLRSRLQYLSKKEAIRMAKGVLRRQRKETTPVVFDIGVRFLDFRWLHLSPIPIYINLLRHPVNRAVSTFYARRYGLLLEDKSEGIEQTEDGLSIDECLRQDPSNRTCGFRLSDANLMTKMFCGSHAICQCIDSECALGTGVGIKKKALDVAKSNMIRQYAVVGLMEEYDDSLRLLEKLLPGFFQGASEMFPKAPHLHSAQGHPGYRAPAEESRRAIWDMNLLDIELYEHARNHFHRLKEACLGDLPVA